MNGRTLYISDLDGTLLNKSAELSEYTEKTLNRLIANGLHFSVASARTVASASKIMSGLQLRLPVVLMNGVVTYDMAAKSYVEKSPISEEVVLKILAVLKKFDVSGMMYRLTDAELMTYYESLEAEPIRTFVEERRNRYYKTFYHADSFFDVPRDQIVYFTLPDTYDRLLRVREALDGIPGITAVLYRDVYSGTLWFLELFSTAASKKNAVGLLREKYGFDRIVGFGDNLNDLPLFEACDVRVAVANAVDEVRAAADYICDTNENDGVIKWIEENM